MRYEVTLTLRFRSHKDEDRIIRGFESLFEFGTIKDSISDGLHLLDDTRLIAVDVKRMSMSAWNQANQ